MTMTLIKGRPGSGKSYECVVHHILPALKEGRKVVTNIPVNKGQFVKVLGKQVEDLLVVHKFSFDNAKGSRESLLEQYNEVRQRQIDSGDEDPLVELTLEQIDMDAPNLADPVDYVSYYEWRNEKGQGALFVIDECHFHFPLQGRGKSATDLAERQIQFFSGHRHYGFDFILLTQSDRKINRLLREDIEICIELRKNRAIGDKSYRRFAYYYGEGKKGGLIDQDSRKYEKQFFPLYQSHTKSNKPIEEARPSDIKKWHQSWYIRLFLIFVIGGGIFVYKSLTNAYAKYTDSPSLSHEKKKDLTSSVDSSSIKPKVSKPKENKPQIPDLIPFSEFSFHISGYSDSSYRDDAGIWHVAKEVYFTGKNKARFEIKLKLEDFYLAGYEVSVFGPCMVKLNYSGYKSVVYCKEEQQQPVKTIADDINSVGA